MPLFGKSKKAQEAAKKQETPPEPKPAPYRHVPKHAASDARTNGLAEADRAAQQKRIMAASQSRLNSMNSNYSVKSNFTNDVPINGGQSKPFFFSASNSPRPSSGNAKGKDRIAVQPGSPAGTTQPHVKAQEDYTKLRNPSLLSNITAPRNSSPLAVTNQTISGADQTSDSGYGSVGQVSRPDSKAPSTISKAPTEPRQSQDVKTVPQIPTGLDFLPKLDFSPESSPPPTAEQPPSPIHVKKPSTITSTRDRAISGASSYVSRLDPGADRRSIISTSSKPFDQIDFSRPGQQFVPVSPTAKSPTTRAPVVKARSVTPITQGDALKQPVQEPWKYRSMPPSPRAKQAVKTETPARQSRVDEVGRAQQSTPAEQPFNTKTPARQNRVNDVSPQLARTAESILGPVKPREPPQYTAPKAAPQDQPSEQSSQDAPRLELKPEQMTNEKPRSPPAPVQQEDEPIQPPTMQPEPSQPQAPDPDDDERGGRTPVPAASPFPPAEPASRDVSSTRTVQSELSKQPTTRHRNWSRPSQSSGSQYGRKESVGGASEKSVQTQAPPRPSNDYYQGLGASERQTDTRDFIPAEPIHSNTRNAQIDQAPQAYVPQSQQGSSIYGDSVYNPSTRQHSPSRRHSFAPSELLDYGHSNGRAALPPLSILDGLKVNKRGKILDEEGDAIGELVEGDIIDCVRQRANAFGHVLDDYGRVVGRVSTVARGDGTPTQSSATTMRSRGIADFRPDPMQRYALPESQIVSPTTPTLARPFEYTQEEDPRQRAAKLQALAARRGGPEPQIELDGSGAAEQTPLVDHSEIFAPPFIPSRSPKRSPAEPEHRMMDNYFARPPEKRQSPPPQEAPRLKKWASRNLEPEREEMQASKQPSAPSTISQPPSERTVSRPSTAETPQTQSQRSSGVLPAGDTGAQDFISSDQPKDIFPWMTGSAPQEPPKWKDANAFTYKGELPSENANSRQSTSTVRSSGAQSQNQSAFATNGATKQYAAHLAATAGSRKSNRTSYRDHQPLAKSPLSTHNLTTPDTSAGATNTNSTSDDSAAQPSSLSRGLSTNTTSVPSKSPSQKTYFTHAGRTSVMEPDTTPTHTSPSTPLTQTAPSNTISEAQEPRSPLDPAVPPDVVRAKEGAKKKSRWSMGFDKFGRKAPPVQNLLSKKA